MFMYNSNILLDFYNIQKSIVVICKPKANEQLFTYVTLLILILLNWTLQYVSIAFIAIHMLFDNSNFGNKR